MSTNSEGNPFQAPDWAGRRPSEAELATIIAAHRRLVLRQQNGARARLNSADLSGVDLSRQYLIEADLAGADLSGANLVSAQLERASLFSAILCNSDLRLANLRGADLRGASLKGADLTFAVLDGADLRAAFMFKVGEEGRFQRSAPKSGESPDGGVDFSNSSLRGASLNEVNLKNANFSCALLEGVTFKRAKIANVNLDGAVLTQADLADLPFPPEALKGCVLDPTPEALERAPLLRQKIDAHEGWVTSGTRQGAPADISGEDVRPPYGLFPGRALTALCARGIIALSVDFNKCQLQGANFENADLRDSSFEDADLRGANFRGAKLAHARFAGADLGPLMLRGGTAKPVDLSGAIFAEGQFSAAAVQPAV